MDDKTKGEVDSACVVAEDFVKLFYETFDKKRSLLSKFFLDTGVLSWDGNGNVGNSKIQQFVDGLPAMEHFLTSLDAHPVLVQNQRTILIKASGFIKLIEKRQTSCFSEAFLITAVEDKWKIATDNCRFQQPVDKPT